MTKKRFSGRSFYSNLSLMFSFVFIFVFLLAILAILFFIGIYLHKQNVPFWQYPIAFIYVLWLLLFLFLSSFFGAEYTAAIDPADGESYTLYFGAVLAYLSYLFPFVSYSTWGTLGTPSKTTSTSFGALFVLLIYRDCCEYRYRQPSILWRKWRLCLSFLSFVQQSYSHIGYRSYAYGRSRRAFHKDL